MLQQKVELDKEAARLEQQNEVLRQAVYAATSGMRVTDEVLADDSNPLLIVNNRLQQFLGVDASNSWLCSCQLRHLGFGQCRECTG